MQPDKKQCEARAVARFTWPGQAEGFCCEKHQAGIERIADAMGFYLQVIPLESDAAPQRCQSFDSVQR